MMRIAPSALALLLSMPALAQQDAGSSIGRLEAKQQTVVSAPIAGVISSLAVSGLADRVEKGQVIAKINCTVATADVSGARARVTKAKLDAESAAAQYNYTTPEGKRIPMISEQEYQARQQEVKVLQSDVAAQRAKQSQCTIRAPFSGQVADIKAKQGLYVNAGDPVIELVDNSQLVAEFKPYSWVWDSYEVGKQATIIILPESLNPKTAHIKVIERGAAIGSDKRFAVRAIIEGESDQFVAGMPFTIDHNQGLAVK